MARHNRTRPISFLKANSAKIIRELGQGAPPLVITQNGEATGALPDVGSSEAMRETLALKLLALGQQEIAASHTAPVAGLADRVRGRG